MAKARGKVEKVMHEFKHASFGKLDLVGVDPQTTPTFIIKGLLAGFSPQVSATPLGCLGFPPSRLTATETQRAHIDGVHAVRRRSNLGKRGCS